MKPSLKSALPYAEMVARLLHPLAEVVVHDLERDEIAAIYNSFSRREVGDSSYLDRIAFDDESTVLGPYRKTNWDGRPLKSISTIIRNEKGVAEGFLCINVDLSAFDQTLRFLEGFIGVETAENCDELFTDDLYERVNRFVQSYCQEKQLALSALGRQEKGEIVKKLQEEGAFKGRNAATYIGRVLGLSRATIYNYLKDER